MYSLGPEMSCSPSSTSREARKPGWQWAAVRTWRSEMRTPPHLFLVNRPSQVDSLTSTWNSSPEDWIAGQKSWVPARASPRMLTSLLRLSCPGLAAAAPRSLTTPQLSFYSHDNNQLNLVSGFHRASRVLYEVYRLIQYYLGRTVKWSIFVGEKKFEYKCLHILY